MTETIYEFTIINVEDMIFKRTLTVMLRNNQLNTGGFSIKLY